MSKLYIVAGTREQYQTYKKSKFEEAIKNNDNALAEQVQSYVYVSEAQYFRGIRDPHGVFVGTWSKRDDIVEIVSGLIICCINENPVLIQILGELMERSRTRAILNTKK